MKKVLFVWELGEGLGHVSPLVAIADALVARGSLRGLSIEPVFALCEPVFGREAIGDRGWRVLAAPRLPAISDIRSRGASYADLLAMFGFGRQRELGLSVAAWDDLFAVVEPDLVVADHSPTACLAARGRLPIVLTGNGYNTPPADLRMYPTLRTEAPVTRNQAVILDTVNAILADRGVPALERLPQLLATDARAVLTLPHFDPYRAFRSEPVLGYHQRVAYPVPAPAEPCIFLYSRATEPDIDGIAQVLGQCGIRVVAHIRGAQTAAASFLAHMGLEVSTSPLPPAELFARASIVISHGGGIAQVAAQAGRPQIILPTHLETVITGTVLENSGAAILLGAFEEQEFADAVRRIASDARYEERALALAREIAALRLPEDPAAVVADRCLDFLACRIPA